NMGWRGFLRSLNAADRARKRQNVRVSNAVNRGQHAIDRILAELDAEIERHVQKVSNLEHKIKEKPVTASGITFDSSSGVWAFKPLRNESGKLTWTATIEVRSNKFRCSGPVDDGNRRYTLVAVAATKWAVFAAMEVKQISSSGKPTKLFTKSTPA